MLIQRIASTITQIDQQGPRSRWASGTSNRHCPRKPGVRARNRSSHEVRQSRQPITIRPSKTPTPASRERTLQECYG